MQDYIVYLNLKKQKNSTIEKEFELLKWFFKWANKKGYYKGNVHNDFNPKFKKVEDEQIICLNFEEIKALQGIEFKEKSLERAKDVFLFCCFTGLRYSDVLKLKKADIKNDHILVVMQKTAKTIKVELNKFSNEILKKYENCENEFALPVISNQKMNDYLKTIGRECGLNEEVNIVSYRGSVRIEEKFKKWELLTTHCGRRTFVANAISLGVPTKVIMKWTGHSTESAMKPYEKIFDEIKQEGMKKFDKIS